MDWFFNTLLGIIFSYFIGAIPIGYLIGKWVKGIDLRDCGSGGTGFANAMRELGLGWGLVVLFSDIFKGAFPLLNAYLLEKNGIVEFFDWQMAIFGCAVIFGHCYSLFIDWKGGKGVAATCGVLLMIHYLIAISGFFCWLIILLTTKKSSLGSLLGILIALITSIILYIIGKISLVFLVSVFVFMSWIIYTHRENIKRLINRQERDTIKK